jgi:hypothetical protein
LEASKGIPSIPKIPYFQSSSAVSTAKNPHFLSIDTVRTPQQGSFRSIVAIED